MKNFKQLRIWQAGFRIALNAHKLVQTFPRQDGFGLARQITRAAVSIPSNIAEGSSRSSEKDYSRFAEISLGSSFELETQILLSEALGLGDQELRKQLLDDIAQEN